jgi:YrbI family 3-deoxy-D-manno-octulosonate 8-phosphate phosphatase
MVTGVTKLRTGVVLVADDVSLRRLGGATALGVTLSRIRSLTCVDEFLIVTDSESVKQLAAAWDVRCLTWQEMGPVTWSQVSDSPNARPASTWPKSTAAPPNTADEVRLRGDELVLSHVELGRGAGEGGALLAGLGLDVIVFVDVACPLWDASDLQAVIAACERSGRASLAVELGSVWVARELTGVAPLESPAFQELSTLRGYRLSDAPRMAPEPILVPKYKGWSLRDSVERLGIDAAWAQTQTHDRLSRLPERVGALVMDFDGVLTDNHVTVDQNGVESVVCSRGDGFGLELLRKAGLPLLVISKERNPVVAARCRKLQIPCLQGIDDKLTALQAWASEQGLASRELIFVGNDVNDLECLQWVGCAAAVHDSHPEVLKIAHLVLEHDGGKGAIREMCELILVRQGTRMPVASEQ